MIIVEKVLGNIGRDAWLRELHLRWQEAGRAEAVTLTQLEAQKGRLLTNTDRGTALGVSLGRGKALCDGDVLFLSEMERRIIVARLKPEEMLVITLKPAAEEERLRVAVQLGHLLGNQHWPVKVQGTSVYVPISIDKQVMETVLKTYDLHGIEYRFEEASVGAISRVIPHHHPHPHEHPC